MSDFITVVFLLSASQFIPWQLEDTQKIIIEQVHSSAQNHLLSSKKQTNKKDLQKTKNKKKHNLPGLQSLRVQMSISGSKHLFLFFFKKNSVCASDT